jgi:hypothetical protein
MAVKVHLEGDGLLYDSETTAFNAAQIIGFLQGQENQSVSTAPRSSLIEAANKPRISPREALVVSNAKTNPQRITALGHYVAEVNGDNGFSLEEVKKALRRAGEPMPKNFGRDVKEAIKNGLIYEEEPDHYVLTERALGYVSDGFPNTENKVSKKQNGRKSSAPRVAMNEELFTKLKENGTGLKNYIDERRDSYKSSASKQVAVIASWLLDEMGMDSMSAADLHAVRRYLGDSVGNPYSQINNAYARDGYFSHSKEGRFFLSGKGEDFGRLESKA